jgi:hypothetical protein
MKNTRAMFAGLLVVCISLSISCAKLPDDGANAQSKHFDNLNRVRYLEIFVVGGNGITGNLVANVYNTTFIPGLDLKANKDTSPQDWVGALNLDGIKKQFSALDVSLNGPKLWMLDWVDIPLGTERELSGKQIPWCATLHLTKEEAKEMGKISYKSTTIERKSKIGYNKGTQVFLIDDAEGTTWIMKGFQLGMTPRWTYEEFAADPASKFKQLPAGWKYRTKVLDQDLIMVPETGIATIMPDEFFNVYDKTGPGYSSYKP